MGFVITVQTEDGDECPEFTRYAELDTRDEVFKETVGKVYADGVAEQIYIVQLIQQSHADETTLLTQRVIPSGLEYTLTIQKLSDDYLLVAHHPVDNGENFRHVFVSWDELRQRFVEQLDSDPEELQRAYAELEKSPFRVLAFEARNLITAAVAAALCTSSVQYK